MPSWCTRGLHKLPWQKLDVLFVENVGNLVCPAVYDLGQAANVVVLSIAKGRTSRSSTR
jgi:hydrogenase nickel incorporation protein HypB